MEIRALIACVASALRILADWLTGAGLTEADREVAFDFDPNDPDHIVQFSAC